LREDVAKQRVDWPERVRQIAPSRLVFIDESGAKTNMTPVYGRSFDAKRLVDHAPHGHYRLTSIIGALRLDGVGACMTVDAAVDGDCFEAYVEKFLAPSLGPGDVVILDNLSSHKRPSVEELVRARGASVMPLPPYSPDLNPIEKMWSKVKQFLRKAKARTAETLLEAIAAALASVTAEDALGWFRSCGYSN
jgi:transposase